jgi:adenylate cyclase class IV
MILEIEFRARFGKEKYDALKAYLDEHAENLGEDNKDCYYYIFSDKLLKLVNNLSQKTTKLSLKLNRIGDGAAFPEVEFYFPSEQFNNARRLLDGLGLPVKVIHGPQERINYVYKNCEVALKYSDAWGYHLEIERRVGSKKEQAAAEVCIRGVVKESGVRLMTEDELKEFTRQVESKI